MRYTVQIDRQRDCIIVFDTTEMRRVMSFAKMTDAVKACAMLNERAAR